MFREMRRNRKELGFTECVKILRRNTSGVLAVLGDDGYPYAVPMSFVLDGDTLYFHCAKSGHKLDAIQRCDKASFCIIDQDEVLPQKYTTCYRSVIVFGRACMVEDADEMREAIGKLAVKYHPQGKKEERDAEIERDSARLCMFKLKIEHMTGKEGIELVKAREKQEE